MSIPPQAISGDTVRGPGFRPRRPAMPKHFVPVSDPERPRSEQVNDPGHPAVFPGPTGPLGVGVPCFLVALSGDGLSTKTPRAVRAAVLLPTAQTAGAATRRGCPRPAEAPPVRPAVAAVRQPRPAASSRGESELSFTGFDLECEGHESNSLHLQKSWFAGSRVVHKGRIFLFS